MNSRTAADPSLASLNKYAIKALKARIRDVGARKVEKKLGFTQQNLSYHLNPKDFTKVNLATLERITTAVTELEKERMDRAKRLNREATQRAQ